MKKLLVLVLVLAMTQLSWAGLATLSVTGGGTDFMPSDEITIQIVASYDEGMGGADTTGSMSFDGVFATAGTAVSTWLHAGFNDLHTSGGVVNTGNQLITGAAGTITTSSPDIGPGEVLWSMVFHVPDVPASTMIDITIDNYFSAATDFADPIFGIAGLTIHVIPEPMTMALLGLGGLFLRRRSK